jgi:hypothetical protein
MGNDSFQFFGAVMMKNINTKVFLAFVHLQEAARDL